MTRYSNDKPKGCDPCGYPECGCGKSPASSSPDSAWLHLNSVFHEALKLYPDSHHAIHYMWNNAIAGNAPIEHAQCSAGSEEVRKRVARIISPTSKFEDFEGITWSRYEMGRRRVAYEKADAVIAFLGAAQASWQPIETNPKDGNIFYIGREASPKHYEYAGRALWDGHGYCDPEDQVAYWVEPTHWQPMHPMPHPPASSLPSTEGK